MKKILTQLLKAVEILHLEKIIHVDIKPSNILYSNGEIKLIDFDFSLAFNDITEIQKKILGINLKSEFLAPEVKEYKFNYKADIYSIGQVLNYMITKISTNYLKEFADSITSIDFNERKEIKNYLETLEKYDIY